MSEATRGSEMTPNKLIGHRVEIPVHYDAWMRGARFGTVTAFRHGALGQSDYLLVKLDHPQIKQRLKLWRPDWPYLAREAKMLARKLWNKHVTDDAIIDACKRRNSSLDNPGFCLACGNECDGVEPDARNYICEVCGAHQVFGAEELLMGLT